ncbi:MAG TPA: hypothetical protein VGK30_02735 [Candidatus Binatia bacterium]|jgi:hypothetical protein
MTSWRSHHPSLVLLVVLALGVAAALVLMRDASGAADLTRLFGRSAP